MRRRIMLAAALAACLSAPIWAADSVPELWVSAHGAALYPFGELADFTYAAAGVGLSLEADGLLVDKLCLGLSVDYRAFIPSLDGVASMQSLAAILTAGYRFDLPFDLSVAPILGGGVGPAFTDSDWSAEVGMQAFAVAGARLRWSFRKEWRLEASAEYLGIGEADAWYSGASLSVGAAWRLPVLGAKAAGGEK